MASEGTSYSYCNAVYNVKECIFRVGSCLFMENGGTCFGFNYIHYYLLFWLKGK